MPSRSWICGPLLVVAVAGLAHAHPPQVRCPPDESLPPRITWSPDTVEETLRRTEACLYTGRLEAGLLMIDGALEAWSRGEGAAIDRARLLDERGRLLVFRSFVTNRGHDDALAALEEGRAIAAEAGERTELAKAHLYLGFAHYARRFTTGEGDYATAREHVRRALELRRELGDPRGEAEALYYLGILDERTGDVDHALERYRASYAIADRHDLALEKSYAGRHIAFVLQDRGELQEALTLFEESLALRERIGFRIYLPFSHIAVGDVQLELGRPEAALTSYEAACKLAAGMESARTETLCLLSRGDAHAALDHDSAADDDWRAALRRAKSLGWERGVELAEERLED